jgi:type I restriction enzyme S subunit
VEGSAEVASFLQNGAIRRLESIYQQKLIALAELKQSLLQKAFSGELPGGKEASTATLKEEEVA